MFTVCFAVYASLVATQPTFLQCDKVDQAVVSALQNKCALIDKDPLATCEARKAGAFKWFFTVRQLELGARPSGTVVPMGYSKTQAVSK